jgi:hypothetical protein
LEELKVNEEEPQADFQEGNNQQPEAAQQQHPNLQCNDLHPGINNWVYVPQTSTVAPYQAYLTSSTVTCPPFKANHLVGKSLMMITTSR